VNSKSATRFFNDLSQFFGGNFEIKLLIFTAMNVIL
jgi:hypothetical protein